MKKTRKKGFAGLVWALLLALELAAVGDLAAAAAGMTLPLPFLAGGAAALFLLLLLLPFSAARLAADVRAVFSLALVAALVSGGFLAFYSRRGAVTVSDDGKSAVFSGRKVLIVPELEGGEEALAGGLAEEFLRYGSEAWLYTSATGQLRAPSGEVLEASAVDALNRVWPDLILCSRGTAAKTVEEAVGTVRERESDYRPLVLEGLERDETEDFYSLNPASTQKPAGLSERVWEQRLRLPVSPASLTRSLLGATGGISSLLAGSDPERSEALSTRNGDRVFWPSDGSGSWEPDFVKLTSGAGDFIYEYYIDRRGRESFEIHSSGEASRQVYTVRCEGDRCSAKLSGGRLDVICPKGRRCTVTLASENGQFSDTVVISNPGRFYRETAPALERFLLKLFDEALPRTNIAALIRHIRG